MQGKHLYQLSYFPSPASLYFSDVGVCSLVLRWVGLQEGEMCESSERAGAVQPGRPGPQQAPVLLGSVPLAQ